MRAALVAVLDCHPGAAAAAYDIMQGVTNLHNGDYHELAVHSGAFGGGVLGGELGAAAGVFTVTLVGATGPVGIIIVVGVVSREDTLVASLVEASRVGYAAQRSTVTRGCL